MEIGSDKFFVAKMRHFNITPLPRGEQGCLVDGMCTRLLFRAI
jgi:hypothetical protein